MRNRLAGNAFLWLALQTGIKRQSLCLSPSHLFTFLHIKEKILDAPIFSSSLQNALSQLEQLPQWSQWSHCKTAKCSLTTGTIATTATTVTTGTLQNRKILSRNWNIYHDESLDLGDKLPVFESIARFVYNPNSSIGGEALQKRSAHPTGFS